MYQKVTNSYGSESTFVKRLSDNAFVPSDSDNADYQEYLAWVAEGNEALPADPFPLTADD